MPRQILAKPVGVTQIFRGDFFTPEKLVSEHVTIIFSKVRNMNSPTSLDRAPDPVINGGNNNLYKLGEISPQWNPWKRGYLLGLYTSRRLYLVRAHHACSLDGPWDNLWQVVQLSSNGFFWGIGRVFLRDRKHRKTPPQFQSFFLWMSMSGYLAMEASWWVVSNIFFTPTWGRFPIWRAYLSDGWFNHQLARLFFILGWWFLEGNGLPEHVMTCLLQFMGIFFGWEP